jgi:uncharacterized membrane protein
MIPGLIAQAAASLFLAGLIWFVQVVHYPLFARVGSESFHRYHLEHSRLTTFVVAGPMLAEAGLALWILFVRPPAVPAWAGWLGAVLVAVVWLSTAFLQVPKHRQLGRGFSGPAQQALVRTNWIRTWAWTGRALLSLFMLWRALAQTAAGGT